MGDLVDLSIATTEEREWNNYIFHQRWKMTIYMVSRKLAVVGHLPWSL
jgi:hypothetical protein